MRTSSLIFITAAVISSAAFSAERTIETEDGIYRLVGDKVAISACAAIINDDTLALKAALRKQRHRFTSKLPVRDFSCNNTNLQVFSTSLGSESAGKFLQRYNLPTGQIKVDEIAQIQFTPHKVASR